MAPAALILTTGMLMLALLTACGQPDDEQADRGRTAADVQDTAHVDDDSPELNEGSGGAVSTTPQLETKSVADEFMAEFQEELCGTAPWEIVTAVLPDAIFDPYHRDDAVVSTSWFGTATKCTWSVPSGDQIEAAIYLAPSVDWRSKRLRSSEYLVESGGRPIIVSALADRPGGGGQMYMPDDGDSVRLLADHLAEDLSRSLTADA
jgi:hypothetical protein